MNEYLAELYGTNETLGIDKVASDEELEKLAEQDFLGRVMAHAYVDELNAIEKQAASLAGAKEAITGAAGRAREAITGAAGRAKSWVKAPGETYTKAREKPGFVRRLFGAKQKSRLEAAKETLSKHKGQALTAGGLATALGAGGTLAALKGKDKKSADEAFEELAAQRAIEMLAEAGYDV